MEVSDLDERFFPMAFVSCCDLDEGAVFVKVFDPHAEVWFSVSLEDWRGFLNSIRARHGPSH